MLVKTRVQYSIAVGVALAVFAFGMAAPFAIASGLGLTALVVLSAHRCARLFQNELGLTRWLLGLIVTLSFLMIGGSAVYYAATVTPFSVFWLVALLPFVSWIVTQPTDVDGSPGLPDGSHHATRGVWVAIVALALIAFFVTLADHQTTDPSRSPWLVVSPAILWWIAAAALGLFFLARQGAVRLAVVGAAAVVFSAVSVALFVFPLGYGFDPFLHQATLDHIALNGTISPKPFYYIGQYAIELIVMLATGASSHTVDTLLVPLLTALLLPAVAATSIWHITKRHIPTALAALGTLLLPLAPFINTTPQGLSMLWSLIVMFLALPMLAVHHRLAPPWVLVIISIAAVLVHPLAGLPALLFVVLTLVQTQPSWSKLARAIVTTLLSIGGAVMLPLAFLVSGPSSQLGWHPERIVHLVPPTFFGTRFDVIGDLLVILGTNLWIWMLALAVLGAWLLRRTTRRQWLVLPLLALILAVNAILLAAAGDFSFLINYEQTNYTDRVVQLALLALAPMATVGLCLGLERLLQMKKATVTWGLCMIVTVAVTGNVFVSYPRHDAYAISRGFTVGESDHNTVASIASHAADTPYIALANQAVSAAAIQDNGFAHYYGSNGDIFYYPVPTGGPMYQLFLEMIEEVATRELALKAMDLAGVDRAYFVVNNYWWSAERAIERAKLSANDWFVVNDGAAWVFVYERET